MCYNEQISLNTFVFSTFVLGLVIYNNTYTQYKIKEMSHFWEYMFFASFIVMQLAEFFIWRNLKNADYNRLFSVCAVLIILSQPVASSMMISDPYVRNITLTSYLILAVPYSIYKFATTDIRCSVSKRGHLIWHFFDSIWVFVAMWLFFLLFGLFYQGHFHWILFGIVTLLFTLYNYHQDRSAWSMWCWLVNTSMLYFAFKLMLGLPMHEFYKGC